MNIGAGKGRKRIFAIAGMAAWWCQSIYAATPVVEIEIRDHLFFPAEVVIPANTKVKLMISNLDPTPEEFESYELNREKVIGGNSKTAIFIGPLPAGEYPFFGEFFPKTAQGKVLVEEK
jgi:hypothetical protein